MVKKIAPQKIPYTNKSTPEAIIAVTDKLRQPRLPLLKPRHDKTKPKTAHHKLTLSELIITHHAPTAAIAPITDIHTPNGRTLLDACSFVSRFALIF